MTTLQKVHMMRCAASFDAATYEKSMSRSSCFARLASGAFCKTVYIIEK
jgi:hypothetical protein